MKVLRYSLFLEQPVIATSLLGDPNSSVSYNYLPGSQLRGLFISRYLQTHPEIENLATNDTCYRLFFNEKTRFLNAYPLSEGKTRCLPTPLSLFRRKNAEYLGDKAIFDASHEDWDMEMRHDVEGNSQLKAIKFPFCKISDDSLLYYTPRRTMTIHIQRNRRKGRALPDDGEIFRYEALASGQWFEGVILVDEASDVVKLEKLFKPTSCWLGRSRSANYGKVKLNLLKIEDNWRETGDQSAEAIYFDEACRLTLLSDFIGLDSKGNPLTRFDNESLEAYLGVPVKIKATHSFSTVRAVGGFNNKWKLPLIQRHAIAAGSVITFIPQETLELADVRRLEAQGLGERRAEGFGRIVFNWVCSMELVAKEGAWYGNEDRATDSNLSPTAQALALRMANRLLEQHIERGILQFVRDYVWAESVGDMPANSQLSRIQTLVRQALPTGDVGLVKRQFAKFERASIEQFERARLEKQSFYKWIKTLLDQPESVWNKVYPREVPEVAGQFAQKDKLTQQTTLRLLAAVLAAPAHKRKE